MKTTMTFRSIANPRRTRLAALTDAEPLVAEENTEVEQAEERPMPQQTANPRRTVLSKLPAGPAAE
jgi:hypothetical protein